MPLSHLSLAALLVLIAFSSFGAGPYMEAKSRTALLLIDVPVAHTSVAGTGKENTRLVSGLLALTLGPFGAHRLYFGTNAKVAIIYGLTFGGFGLLPLLDLGHIIFSKDLDLYMNNNRVFMWQARSIPQ